MTAQIRDLCLKLSQRLTLVIILALFSLLHVSCTKEESSTPMAFNESNFPELTDPELVKGREVWVADCKTCHLPGKQGAPKIGFQEAWSERIAKGEEELIKNAINGFDSPAGYEMPARGGNDALSDQDVSAAVRYMVFRSQ